MIVSLTGIRDPELFEYDSALFALLGGDAFSSVVKFAQSAIGYFCREKSTVAPTITIICIRSLSDFPLLRRSISRFSIYASFRLFQQKTV